MKLFDLRKQNTKQQIQQAQNQEDEYGGRR